MSSQPRSVFIRHFRHRARRFLPGPTRPPSLVTSLPVRPARFVLGLSETVRWADFRDAQSAPVLPAFYLGRVEEVLAEGVVLATLWERPSGRELSTELSVETHFQGKPPPIGSLLRVWTWLELREGADGRARRVDRVKVETEPASLSEGDRARLRAVLERLKSGEPVYGSVLMKESAEAEAGKDADEAG